MSSERAEWLTGDWTAPREDCPVCGAQLLANRLNVRWCSATGCAYVKPASASPGITASLESCAGSGQSANRAVPTA